MPSAPLITLPTPGLSYFNTPDNSSFLITVPSSLNGRIYVTATSGTSSCAIWSDDSTAFGLQTVGTNTTLIRSTSNSTAAAFYSNAYYSTLGSQYVSVPWTPPSQAMLRSEARKESAAVQRAKNSIKRALKLMDGVGFGKDVQVFLGGDSIEVSHPESLFKFLLTKSKYGTLIDKTIRPGFSTPYNLQLYTKTDVHVANLCVYMEKTPVLDQVLALSMYIKSGNEDLILSQANWSLYADEFERESIGALRPDLRKKLRLDMVRPQGQHLSFERLANVV